MSHFFPGDKMSQLMHVLMHRKVMESCWDILSVVPLCQFEGQYLGQRLRIYRTYIGHILSKFWAYLEVGHFVARRKFDILSSGTICRPKNAVGTICRWDKMSLNRPDIVNLVNWDREELNWSPSSVKKLSRMKDSRDGLLRKNLNTRKSPEPKRLVGLWNKFPAEASDTREVASL